MRREGVRHPWIAAALALSIAASAAGGWARAATSRGPRYAGAHPVPSSVAAATFCHIDVPHVHAYAPDHGALYAQTAAGLRFAGDPTPFGYRGPTHVYVGHHPLAEAPAVACFLDGPHRHAAAPADAASYRIAGGAAFFVGAMPPGYQGERAVRSRAFTAVYAASASARPVVEAEPPPEWRATAWGASGMAAATTSPPPPPAAAAPAVPPSNRPADGGAR